MAATAPAIAEPAPTVTPPAAAAMTTTAVPAAQAAHPAQRVAPSPTVICFKSSIRCFAATPGTSANPSARAKALDLRAPALTRVFSEAELSQKLPDPDEQRETEETVKVQGQRPVAPVPGGLMAIPWALFHPTQAWRIFAPVPEAK